MPMTLPVDPGLGTCPLDPFADLPVGLDNAAEILAESVLVENAVADISHGPVPEPAGVGTDLIRHHQVTAGSKAQLNLKIH